MYLSSLTFLLLTQYVLISQTAESLVPINPNGNWTTTCDNSFCRDIIRSCVEDPNVCIGSSLCERCVHQSTPACDFCMSSLSVLAPAPSNPIEILPGMNMLCNSYTEPFCRFACRYQTWNYGVCDPQSNCICAQDLANTNNQTGFPTPPTTPEVTTTPVPPVFGFLSAEMSSDLIDLIGFPKTDKWSLIYQYQGSKDGYAAARFHAKCDNKFRTLTIIRSTKDYIFGGYTDAAWDQSGVYQYDPNAFIFSLKNKQNKPVVFRHNEGYKQTIFGHNLMGPAFGGGFDFIINTLADITNTNAYSSSSLGHTFNTTGVVIYGTDEASSFLAGEKFFFLTDYTVYQRNE